MKLWLITKNLQYISILIDCMNLFPIHLSIMPGPWPWPCLTTMGLPGDRWVVADLGCCHRHDPHPLIWIPLTPDLPHPHGHVQQHGLLAGPLAIPVFPLFSLFGSHGTVPHQGLAALPAPPITTSCQLPCPCGATHGCCLLTALL